MNALMWLLCLGSVGVVVCRPSQNSGYRLVPRRAVMFGGYYSNPLFSRSHDFVPHGAMSAVVTRDTVATNSYAGNPPQYPPLDVLPVEENETVERYTEKATELIPPQYIPPEAPIESQQPVEVDAVLPPGQPDVQEPQEELLSPPVAPSEVPLPEKVDLVEDVSADEEIVTKATKRVSKKKPVRPPPVEVDDEEDEEQGLSALWPFAGGKGSVPSYNAFFPITISGGAPSVRTRSQGATQGLDDYIPGSATAIANSFSTGKGGIATSHATSFGDPYLASLVRNGLLNFRSKKPQES